MKRWFWVQLYYVLSYMPASVRRRWIVDVYVQIYPQYKPFLFAHKRYWQEVATAKTDRRRRTDSEDV